MNPARCEIRIPTYRRPAWLRRALDSLRAQTHRDWVALVFDDSPAQEGAAVVRELADPRIVYRPNGRNLGAAANLDQSFHTGPLADGGFACVLEDDNWLLPTFLAENLKVLACTDATIVLRNQQIWRQSGDQFLDTGRTTRGDWFTEGAHSVLELRAHLFFHEGISNGGLFWRTTSRSNLQIGPHVSITGVQEYCRTISVQDPLWFAAEPLAVWANLEPDAVVRGPHADRSFARAVQQIRIALVANHGAPLLALAKRLAVDHHAETALQRSLADLTPTQRWRHRLPTTLDSLKNYLRYLIVPDPLPAAILRLSA
jgi:hypothetical protein